MASGALQQVDGALAGAWIKPALEGDWGGRVKNLVPQIYEAYARVFHPVTSEDGKPVTWEEVARRLGTVAHREMQWHAIVGSWDSSNFTDSRWPGGRPDIMEPPVAVVEALRPLLARHTATPESVYLGLSTIRGYGNEERPDLSLYSQTHRDWLVLHGPLSAIDQIEFPASEQFTIAVGFGIRQSDGSEPVEVPDEPEARLWYETPNLIWPEDRAWFVQSEYDFDSTVLGGSRALIDALLAAPDLEVWEVDGEVSLTESADKLNPVPDPPPGWGEPQDPEVLTRNFVDERLGMLAGTVTAAATDPGGVLTVEVDGGRTPGWRLSGAHSSWPQQDVAWLVGKVVEAVELDPDTDALRCRFADGAELEVVPLPSRGEEDPPSWQVLTPLGMTLRHGPGLGIEFPQEP